MKFLFPLASALALVIACSSGCATRSAAERRVEKHPDLMARLNDRERELVYRGEVAEGMSRDAVYLAWGRPDMVRTGSRDGKGTESWAFFDTTPVQSVSIGFGTGGYHSFYSDFGFHPRFGYGVGPGWGYGTGVDFLSNVEKTVEFSNGKVVAWERLR